MTADRNDEATVGRSRGGGSCPICGKPSTQEARPFCSKRCADIDLHRWLGGVYVVAGADARAASVDDHDADDVG